MSVNVLLLPLSLLSSPSLPPSLPTSLPTSLPPSDLPPVTVTVLSVSTTWVWLTWSDPSPQRYPLKLNSFTIYYTADDLWVPSPIPDSSTVPDQFRNVTTGPASRYGNLTELRPSTVYMVLVGYTAGDYWSELSQTQSVTTLEGGQGRRKDTIKFYGE